MMKNSHHWAPGGRRFFSCQNLYDPPNKYWVLEVGIACSGIECLSRLRNRIPHLIVLDAGLLWGQAAGFLAIMDERTGFIFRVRFGNI